MSDRNGAVTNREAENSRGAKESGATIPRPPNLVGKAKSDRCNAPGESRPIKARINLLPMLSQVDEKKMTYQELYSYDTYSHLLIKP